MCRYHINFKSAWTPLLRELSYALAKMGNNCSKINSYMLFSIVKHAGIVSHVPCHLLQMVQWNFFCM